MSSPIYTRTQKPLQNGIICEILETIPQDIRRDNLLDDILTPTFHENDSINKE